VLLLFFVVMLSAQEKNYVTIQRTHNLMGTNFDIVIVAESETAALKNIDDIVNEIKRIEKLISSWDTSSETSLINKNAGIQPVKVSAEIFDLIKRSISLSKLTNGAFDITFASMNTVWKFDGSLKNLPSHEEINSSISSVGYENIILNKELSTVFLPRVGMKIGFDAIGKGYAVDKAKELMQSKKVFAGAISSMGDLVTWGRQASGEKWIYGIANPQKREDILTWLPLDESAVATSDNYKKYIVFNGEKYAHIIDPRTGYPTKGINRVSVFSKSAEFSDAIATAIFVMGVKAGLEFAKQLDNIEIIIVDVENHIHKTSGIKIDASN